jgi:hypothetical protein
MVTSDCAGVDCLGCCLSERRAGSFFGPGRCLSSRVVPGFLRLGMRVSIDSPPAGESLAEGRAGGHSACPLACIIDAGPIP